MLVAYLRYEVLRRKALPMLTIEFICALFCSLVERVRVLEVLTLMVLWSSIPVTCDLAFMPHTLQQNVILNC